MNTSLWSRLLPLLVAFSLCTSVHSSDLLRILNKNEASGTGYDAGENLGALARVKRWDYNADGCGCSGYHIACFHDSHCQVRHKDRNWKCVKNCCGFRCVPK